MCSKRKSLADKISELLLPDQEEDDDDFNNTETSAKVVDTFDEEEYDDQNITRKISELRKKNAAPLIGERYTGKKISRKSIENDDSPEESINEDESMEDEEGSDDTEEMVSDEADEINESQEEEEEEGSEEEDDDDGFEDYGDMFQDDVNNAEQKDENFKHFSKTDRSAEVEKGSAVKNQLSVWDNLMEVRIQMQKCLIGANQLPVGNNYEQFKSESGTEFNQSATQCKNNISQLLDSLLNLQSELYKKNSETKALDETPTKKDIIESDEEITSSDSEDEDELPKKKDSSKPAKKKRKLSEYSNLLQEKHESFLAYRNSTIQKWNDKTRVAQGKISSKNFSAFEQSTVKQIEQILTDKHRLLKRTRQKRSNYKILGEPEKEINDENDDKLEHEFNNEIFDDDDFYHQLLRELIEHKSEGVTDPIQLGRQWIALQKVRNKMKRHIDTRATKGRKIRYAVHPKLVNFMAPYDNNSWTDDSKNELYRSLFAK